MTADKGHGRRRGAVVVEAALVLPMVLLLFIGVMEYGRWLMTMHLASNAAREGAEYAAKHTATIYLDGRAFGSATSDVVSMVNARLAAQRLIGQTVSVYRSDSLGNNLGDWNTAQAGEYVCVKISGSYQFVTPKLLSMPASMNASFQSVKRSEGN